MAETAEELIRELQKENKELQQQLRRVIDSQPNDLIEEQREIGGKTGHTEHVNAKLTPHAREEFLEMLKRTCNVSKSARLIGISRRRAYQVRKKDKEFAKAWAEAIEIATDTLEEEARRRAMDGVDRPQFYQGKICGYIKEYSDKLMDTLLAAHRPAKYRPSMLDLPPGAEIRIGIKTPDNAESKAIDVTPKQIEEEQALTE
jgi:DNA-binding transcriptional regulator YdaS (Cro superfamily)